MDEKNKKLTKILHRILLVSLVLLGIIYVARIVVEVKYQKAAAELEELLSEPETSLDEGEEPKTPSIAM